MQFYCVADPSDNIQLVSSHESHTHHCMALRTRINISCMQLIDTFKFVLYSTKLNVWTLN